MLLLHLWQQLNDKITEEVYWKLRPVKSCIFGSGNIFSVVRSLHFKNLRTNVQCSGSTIGTQGKVVFLVVKIFAVWAESTLLEGGSMQ